MHRSGIAGWWFSCLGHGEGPSDGFRKWRTLRLTAVWGRGVLLLVLWCNSEETIPPQGSDYRLPPQNIAAERHQDGVRAWAGVRQGSERSFHTDIQLSQHNLLSRPSSLHLTERLGLWVRSMDLKCAGLFLDFLFYSIELCVFFFLCQYRTVLSTAAFKLESMKPPTLTFFFSAAWLLWVPCVSM